MYTHHIVINLVDAGGIDNDDCDQEELEYLVGLIRYRIKMSPYDFTVTVDGQPE